MTGTDLIDALKHRGEWGSYFTFEGYEFLKSLRNTREVCIALRAWGAADVRETDPLSAVLDKLEEALQGRGRSPLSHGAPPWLAL